MEILKKSYNRDTWVSAGPGLVTRTWKSWTGRSCFTVLDSSHIYPVPYNLRQIIFNGFDKRYEFIEEGLNKSFAIHYWNRKTSHLRINQSSPLYKIYHANCIICKVQAF